MSRTRTFYLILTIIGFVLGAVYIYPITVDHKGFDVIRFVQETSLNSSSRLLMVDLGWTALTFFAFLAVETRRLRVQKWWLAIPGSFLVGICFSFPLFLFLRQGEIDRQANQQSQVVISK